ncbi:uncharacterized protein LOC129187901 isoform X2 [Dunckerocampus dactyliophorus]|uniref:uncharacterized protein LOC129187901 isoform X2 n=1 Tax=Dunckerocampus dactyliophorus TaxID=161453 RepID=UPI0024056025|nr:uncharacterized protein LOC129187901 isoform X2 [Dunckerocampus dactyliophorus]
MAYHYSALFIVNFLVLVSAQDVEYYLKGQEIRLVPSIIGKPDGILWMHDGNEVVYFVGMEQSVFPPYENKIILDQASAELTIKNATYEDSGEYALEVLINKRVHPFHYRIEVIDKVSKPSISCEMSDTNRVTLFCATESKHPHLLHFTWSSRGNQQTGPNLPITVRNEDDDQVYRCDVSNPLTNEMASFTVKDCFLDKRSHDLLAICAAACALITVSLALGFILGCVCRGKHPEYCKPSVLKRQRNATQEEQHNGFKNKLAANLLKPDTAPRLAPFFNILHFPSTTAANTPTQLEDVSKNQKINIEAFAENGESEDDLPSLNANIHRREGIRRSNSLTEARHGRATEIPHHSVKAHQELYEKFLDSSKNCAASSASLNFPLTSTDMNTTTELEDISQDQQVYEGPSGENVKREDDLLCLNANIHRRGEGIRRSKSLTEARRGIKTEVPHHSVKAHQELYEEESVDLSKNFTASSASLNFPLTSTEMTTTELDISQDKKIYGQTSEKKMKEDNSLLPNVNPHQRGEGIRRSKSLTEARRGTKTEVTYHFAKVHQELDEEWVDLCGRHSPLTSTDKNTGETMEKSLFENLKNEGDLLSHPHLYPSHTYILSIA